MLNKIKRPFQNLSPTQFLVLSFAGIILIGAVLLSLPVASRSGQWTAFINSLFTATSATCVTGLVVFDTYQYWSGFGQAVILMLIQVGGLGLMTVATLLSFFIRRNISFKERTFISQSLSLNELSGVVRLTKHILIGTLLFEGLGAIALSIRFIPEFGVAGGIIKGIFHSVSAFCNAGFDIMGQRAAFSSLTAYVSDITVNITIMSLIVIGGLGFFVWEDLYNLVKRKRKLSVYSKLVIGITACLIIGGAVLIFIFESNNPDTFGHLSPLGKVLASFFQSVTPRTAGYNTLNLVSQTDNTKILQIFLMFIGGSSGSTAGGIKTVTFGILLLTIFQVARGRRDIVVLGRKVSNDNVLRAFTIAGIGFLLVIFGSLIISFIEPGNNIFLKSLYECVSAFGTVGLSLGLTPSLSAVSKIILIMLMYFGRVGILTITFSIVMGHNRDKDKLSYPESNLLVG